MFRIQRCFYQLKTTHNHTDCSDDESEYELYCIDRRFLLQMGIVSFGLFGANALLCYVIQFRMRYTLDNNRYVLGVINSHGTCYLLNTMQLRKFIKVDYA